MNEGEEHLQEEPEEEIDPQELARRKRKAERAERRRVAQEREATKEERDPRQRAEEFRAEHAGQGVPKPHGAGKETFDMDDLEKGHRRRKRGRRDGHGPRGVRTISQPRTNPPETGGGMQQQ